MDSTLNSAIRATVSLLTACLTQVYPPSTVDSMHLILMSTLSAHLAGHWFPENPSRDASFRGLLMGPQLLPPKPLRIAAEATGVSWSDWIILLSRGEECEVFVDPGMVSFRVGNSDIQIHWHGQQAMARSSPWESQASSRTPQTTYASPRSPKTPHAAQSSSWMADMLAQFPTTPKNTFPAQRSNNTRRVTITRPTPSAVSSCAVSDASASPPPSYLLDLADEFGSMDLMPSTPFHTRTTSQSSSVSSSAFSALSLSASQSSASSSASSLLSTRASSPILDCDMECDIAEADEADDLVYIDVTRNTVTEYECGKVGVLGGAVMLGVPKGASAIPVAKAQKLRHF